MKTNILILVIILFASQAWGATYYVKAGGNDSAAGTSDATAWAHCPGIKGWTGSANLKSGDIVHFRSQDTWTGSRPVLTATAGVTYDGATYGSGTRATIKSTNAGAGTTAMVVKIYVSNVTFTGFDVDYNDYAGGGIYVGMYATSNFSNVTIDNCIVHNADRVTQQYGYGIHVGNRNGHTISNITITDSTVHDVFGEGFALYQGWNNPDNRTDTVLVQNCTAYDCSQGMLIANDTDNVTIENCNIYNNRKNGIWIRTSIESDGYPYSVTSGPNNFTIRYNLIHDNTYSGINTVNPRWELEETTISGVIHNNFIYENGTNTVDGYDLSWAGSSGNNGSDYGGCDFKVFNNTFYTASNQSTNSKASVSVAYWGDITGGDFRFQNNIFYIGNTYVFFTRHRMTNGSITHTNNLYYRSDSSSNPVIYDRGTIYNRAATTTWEATAQNTDPSFVDVSSHDYKVQAGSNALNDGVDLSAYFTRDYYGTSRKVDSSFDIGAYEYDSSPSAPTGLKVVVD